MVRASGAHTLTVPRHREIPLLLRAGFRVMPVEQFFHRYMLDKINPTDIWRLHFAGALKVKDGLVWGQPFGNPHPWYCMALEAWIFEFGATSVGAWTRAPMEEPALYDNDRPLTPLLVGTRMFDWCNVVYEPQAWLVERLFFNCMSLTSCTYAQLCGSFVAPDVRAALQGSRLTAVDPEQASTLAIKADFAVAERTHKHWRQYYKHAKIDRATPGARAYDDADDSAPDHQRGSEGSGQGDGSSLPPRTGAKVVLGRPPRTRPTEHTPSADDRPTPPKAGA